MRYKFAFFGKLAKIVFFKIFKHLIIKNKNNILNIKK